MSIEEIVETVVTRCIRQELERWRQSAAPTADERVSLTVAAARSGYGVATIRKWAATGLIKSYGTGRAARFSLAEVLSVAPPKDDFDVDAKAEERMRSIR